MWKAIGLVETKNITKGILFTDTILKKSPIEVIKAFPLCPGKYMIMLSGDLGAVKNALEVGKGLFKKDILDSCIIGNIHPRVLAAISNEIKDDISHQALGIIETYTVASAIIAADTAAKTAVVNIINVEIAQGLGGKCYISLTGDMAAVESAVDAGANAIAKEFLVDSTVIPSPDKSLWKHLLKSESSGNSNVVIPNTK